MDQNSDGLKEQWSSGYGARFPIQRFWGQNHWLAPRSTQPFTLSRSIKLVAGTLGKWVVKSKLSPDSGSVVLRQLSTTHRSYSFL